MEPADRGRLGDEAAGRPRLRAHRRRPWPARSSLRGAPVRRRRSAAAAGPRHPRPLPADRQPVEPPPGNGPGRFPVPVGQLVPWPRSASSAPRCPTAGSASAPPRSPLGELLARDVGDHAPDAALWTERERPPRCCHRVARVDLAALRETPDVERASRRCGAGRCACWATRRPAAAPASAADLCAARALPIAAADRGPAPPGRPRPRAGSTSTRASGGGEPAATFEYLQFLRGSGVHPLGSLLQLTDAFNRLVLRAGARADTATGWPPPGSRSRRWRRAPRTDCARAAATGDPVRDGLCDVVRTRHRGARARPACCPIRRVVDLRRQDRHHRLAGRRRRARRPPAPRFNEAHTLPDRPRARRPAAVLARLRRRRSRPTTACS